ncbi:MFS transporter [Capsulimonas corticalis]|uniref:MFS transporter n=1 Tax=Capsulimonas corticalis TaxID=2219043 RepID=A0A402CVB1_9BACT|nr:MFS transporter [Capsulimonas corticalis]BDI30371.1 MFS transporter [Capsulimonas corticalis]
MIETERLPDAPRSFMNRFPALRSRDYRLLWLGQGVSGIGSFMQVAALNWQLYLLTGSALSLGMIGLFRVIPIVLLSLIGGAVADAWDRRKVMMVTQTVLMLNALALGLLTVTHHISAPIIYLLTVVGGAAMAFDNPSRQSLIPRLVPREDLASALSLNSIVFRTSTIAGPVLAGLLIARGGIPITYFLNAASFVAVFVALVMMRPTPPTLSESGERSQVNLAALKEGLLFVMSTPLLVWTLWLDFFATFFSSASSLLPIFAKDILHVGPRGYGVLGAADAIGALLVGLWMSVAKPMHKQGRVVIWAVIVYGAATIVFGASRSFALSLLALAVVGGADAISTILRQTIRQLMTPDRLRGRMTSVNMIFFMGGPQLGEFETGVAANLLGTPGAVILGGVACLATVAWVAAKGTVLREYEFDAEAKIP